MIPVNIFSQIASKIIQEQELIIGPLAWDEAQKVVGIRVPTDHQNIEILDEDQKEVINRLVAQYERLFGEASREACREAVGSLIAKLTPTDVPASLK